MGSTLPKFQIHVKPKLQFNTTTITKVVCEIQFQNLEKPHPVK